MNIATVNFITLVSILLVLSGCKSSTDIETLDETLLVNAELSTGSFAEYASVSRRPGRGEASQKKRYQQFLSDNVVMDYLLLTEYKNDLSLKLDLIDKRSRAVLKAYNQQQVTTVFTEQKISNFYDKNIDIFSVFHGEVGKLKFRFSGLVSAKSRLDQKTLAESVRQSLVAGTLDFASAIEKFSDSSNRKNTVQNLGEINLQRLGQHQKAVESLVVGEVTQVLQDADGWVIYQLQGELKRVANPIASLKPQIRYRLKQALKKQREQDLVQKIALEKGLKTERSTRGLMLVNNQFGEDALAAYAKLKGFTKGREQSLQQAFQAFSHRLAMAEYIFETQKTIESSLKFLISRNEALKKFHFKKLIDVGITEQSLQTYFETQKSSFNRSYAEVAVIKLNVDVSASDDEHEATVNLMQNIFKQLQSDQMNFVEAVGQYSQDQFSNQKQGSLGRVEITSLPGEPQELLHLDAGQITSVQSTPTGYVIYRLLSEIEQQALPFDEVKSELRKLLAEKLTLEERARLSTVAKAS